MNIESNLCQFQIASLERAVIVDRERWQAICINCYDLVSKGVTQCDESIDYIIKKALHLAKKLNLPAILWTTSDPKESELATHINQLNEQIIHAKQHFSKID